MGGGALSARWLDGARGRTSDCAHLVWLARSQPRSALGGQRVTLLCRGNNIYVCESAIWLRPHHVRRPVAWRCDATYVETVRASGEHSAAHHSRAYDEVAVRHHGIVRNERVATCVVRAHDQDVAVGEELGMAITRAEIIVVNHRGTGVRATRRHQEAANNPDALVLRITRPGYFARVLQSNRTSQPRSQHDCQTAPAF